MTWKTSQGERVLGPCEAKLFMDFLDLWWWNNEEFDDSGQEWTEAEEPFNSLSAAQKHTVIEEVLTHLITETPDCPKLTAANESCIWSIFQNQIDNDLEGKKDIYGQKILDALEERGCKIKGGSVVEDASSKLSENEEEMAEDHAFWPYKGCQDEQKWNEAIEFLADCILWDRDWEMPWIQSNPLVMSMANIDRDYFQEPVAIAGSKKRLEAFNQAIIQKEYAALEKAALEKASTKNQQ